MPVLEYALLPLRPHISTTPLDPRLLSVLSLAKRTQDGASGFSTYYFQQIEDPSVLVILGSWSSPSTHFQFLGTKENEAVRNAIGGFLRLDEVRMWHVEVLDDGLDDGGDGGREARVGKRRMDLASRIAVDAPVLAIMKYGITSEPATSREDFERSFVGLKPLLEEYAKPRPVVAGWRIEREMVEGGGEGSGEGDTKRGKAKEEFMLFSGFDSMEKHSGFSKTEGFEKYKAVTQWVDDVDMKHVRNLKIEAGS